MDNQETRHHHREWNLSSLGVGLVIIAIGVFFLLYNFNVRLPFMRYHNWWALFILIGAIGPLAQAVRAWRAKGGFDANVLHSLTSAAVIITIALFFLFDVLWNRWWPVFLIYGGLWAIARRTHRKPDTT
ncbi:MAG: LiaF transmembrane domain-containing protein [Gammaproteobacteria bacterium]